MFIVLTRRFALQTSIQGAYRLESTIIVAKRCFMIVVRVEEEEEAVEEAVEVEDNVMLRPLRAVHV